MPESRVTSQPLPVGRPTSLKVTEYADRPVKAKVADAGAPLTTASAYADVLNIALAAPAMRKYVPLGASNPTVDVTEKFWETSPVPSARTAQRVPAGSPVSFTFSGKSPRREYATGT